jgi:thymidylate kinase
MKRNDADVLIFDRYIYDELANLPLHRGFVRLYVRFILSIVPTPDVAYLVDADPEAARARKPEYPLDFLRHNRERYLALSRLMGNMTIIGPASVEAAQASMVDAWAKCLMPPAKPAPALRLPASGL